MEPSSTITFLFTDVVGSTRLWDRAPGAMAAAMERHDRITRDQVGAAGGEVVKHTGDGVFATFTGALAALDAARRINQAIAEHDWSPLSSFSIRTGLHAGGAERRDGDWFGPEVNRAARIMERAGPGEILVSGEARSLAEPQPDDVAFVDLGDHALRGLSAPQRVYRVSFAGEDESASPAIAQARQATWLAVLPLAAIADDDGWLADAITDDLITGLGRWRSLRVIGRTSSFQYRDTTLAVPEIARELGVQFVLEGSIRRTDEVLRVTARLLEATTGSQVWTEQLDTPYEDLLAAQERLVHTIVGAIDPAIRIVEGVSARLETHGDLGAWEAVQRAWAEIYRFRPDALARGLPLAEHARRLAPDMAEAHAAVAFAHAWSSWLRFVDDPDASARLAVEAGREAVRLDPYNANAHLAHGWARYASGQVEEALHATLRAVELNPSLGPAYAVAGGSMAHGGNPEGAIELLDRAIELTPKDPGMNWFFGARAIAHFMRQAHDDAIADAEAALRVRSGYLMGRVILIAALVERGDLERGRREWSTLMSFDPEFSMAYLERYVLTDRDRSRIEAALAAVSHGA